MVGKTAYPYAFLKNRALCPAFLKRLAVSLHESAQADDAGNAKRAKARIPIRRLNMYFSSVEVFAC
jgi:hypothetical protein